MLLALQVDRASPFHSREYVVDGLATKTNEFGTDDPWDEVLWDVLHSLRACAVQSLAEDGCHGASERLDFGA